ncbi:HMG box [Cordyceps militaris]|uniref:HMG box n=1 Tax=Cordyceps militaris TaxID=73501 RepID=A0A2H4SJE2_CORMI|nr:HMG box [Cordyceps militaris]
MSPPGQSNLPMKTREIPSYASNHILRTSPGTGVSSVYISQTSDGIDSMPPHSSSAVHPAEVSRQTLVGESSEFLSVDTSNAMTRASHRSGRDGGGNRGRSKEPRVEKRNTKNAPSICLTKPLSEIAREVPGVGVADVTTFARRSAEIRQMEAAKAGKVKRPLNAFILYRKAYQDVAMTQITRSNHQQVSAICGASWNGWEPPSVIKHFKDLANIEKQMHEAAFPAYKYDPVQAKKPKDTTNQTSSACGLSDVESSCRPRRSGRQRTARGTSRIKQSFPLEVPDHYRGLQGLHSQPVGGNWEPHQTIPFSGWYEPARISTEASQYPQRGAGQGPSGPVAGTSYACTSSSLYYQPYSGFGDQCLDPSLRAEAPGSQYAQFLGANHDMLPDWMNVGGAQNASTTLVPDLDVTGAHTAYLQGTEGDWQVEQLEDGSHFSDWMTQAGNGEQQ